MKIKDPNQSQRQNVIQFHPKLEDMKGITCSCGSLTFEKRYMLRYLSRLVSPNGQPMVLEVPVMHCPHCGNVYDQEAVLAAGNAMEEASSKSGKSALSVQPLNAHGTMATSTPETKE